MEHARVQHNMMKYTRDFFAGWLNYPRLGSHPRAVHPLLLLPPCRDTHSYVVIRGWKKNVVRFRASLNPRKCVLRLRDDARWLILASCYFRSWAFSGELDCIGTRGIFGLDPLWTSISSRLSWHFLSRKSDHFLWHIWTLYFVDGECVTISPHSKTPDLTVPNELCAIYPTSTHIFLLFIRAVT